jgi:outer membrane murein-binding lipoprotein Lpp
MKEWSKGELADEVDHLNLEVMDMREKVRASEERANRIEEEHRQVMFYLKAMNV